MVKLGDTISFRSGKDGAVKGIVKYIGPLEEDTSGSEWLGVDLESPVGRHSGKNYFVCRPRHGLFIRSEAAGLPAVESDGSVQVKMGPLFSDYIAGLAKAAGTSERDVCPYPDRKISAGDVLVIVDLQYDFLPGGSFGVDEGDDVVPATALLIPRLVDVGATVVATRDYHPCDHASFNTQGGPFPAHCVQGSRGSKLCPPIAAAMTQARKRAPSLAHIVFKGWHKDVDSFGSFTYTEKANSNNGVPRLSQRDPADPKKHCDSLLSWTGCSLLMCSNIDSDINAPPDVMAVHDRQGLASVLGNDFSRRIYIVGLALDFCVLDSAITAREAGYQEVYIILDLGRAAHVGQWLTPPEQFLEKVRKFGVRLVWSKDAWPLEKK